MNPGLVMLGGRLIGAGTASALWALLLFATPGRAQPDASRPQLDGSVTEGPELGVVTETPPSVPADPEAQEPAEHEMPAGEEPAPNGAPQGEHARPSTRPGGVNPCMTPDPGYGIYDTWSRGITMGQMLAPQRGGVTKNGGFDLIVHFHGHYPIRKEFVKEARGVVLVAIDLGIGSGSYSSAFASPDVFERLIDSVEREMAKRTGKKKAHVRKLALSAWSAGYGAVAQIIQQRVGKRVDALVLLDSVHAGYLSPGAEDLQKRLKIEQITPFLEFAKKAARGDKLMFQSHSSIVPPGYGSTREVSRYIVEQLGGGLRVSKRNDVLGLALDERFDRRGYHVRGYMGEDKPDHCAHLGLFKDVLKVHLGPRWRSPKGKMAPGQKAKASGASGSANAPAAFHGAGPKGPALRAGEKVHVVANGQSLGKIAKRHGVTVDALRERNGLTKGGREIQPDEELVIPRPSDQPAKASQQGPKLAAGEKIHVVADGQSLGKISKRHGVSVDAIRARNGLPNGRRKIQPGDKLVIPAITARAAP